MDYVIIVVTISIYITLFSILLSNRKEIINLNSEQVSTYGEANSVLFSGFRSKKELDEFIERNKDAIESLKANPQSQKYFLASKHIKVDYIKS